jgi:hypothetical protein
VKNERILFEVQRLRKRQSSEIAAQVYDRARELTLSSTAASKLVEAGTYGAAERNKISGNVIATSIARDNLAPDPRLLRLDEIVVTVGTICFDSSPAKQQLLIAQISTTVQSPLPNRSRPRSV